MLSAGTAAPPFTLPDQYGSPVSLADFSGHWVLMWWYPKAETPGCTVEGQGLRDRAEDFLAVDCQRLGASFDTVEENRRFSDAQDFDFPLLSDVDHRAGEAYEVVRSSDDQYAAFPRRTSFLIDPDGVIKRVYAVADVDGHADAVLHDIARLRATA